MHQQEMYFKSEKHSHSYTDSMQKRSYKREFVDKVKQKFNDLQSSNNNNNNAAAIKCNDKRGEVRNTSRVVVRN